jgi:hypothetical protein
MVPSRATAVAHRTFGEDINAESPQHGDVPQVQRMRVQSATDVALQDDALARPDGIVNDVEGKTVVDPESILEAVLKVAEATTTTSAFRSR